jgi:hypothetical protein
MRRRTALFLVLSVSVLVLGGLASSQAACTLAGSCKSLTGDITCGTGGTQTGAFRIYANGIHTGNMNQTEVEACNDQGAGNSQGRLVVRANHNATNPGARVSLDSDQSQTPPEICCGYINAQAGAQGTGVWCSEDGAVGDGYSQGWATPGSDGMAGNESTDAPLILECVPTQ